MDAEDGRAIALIGLRFDGYGRSGNQTIAVDALRAAGLVEALGTDAVDRGDITPRRQSGERGPNGLINEAAILFVADRVAGSVMGAISQGAFPIVVGGDCSALIGSIVGARAAAGEVGLVHVDGHEDTTPIDASEDGEAANSEIGMLLGIAGRTVGWAGSRGLPALQHAQLALLGQRDAAWRAGLNVAPLAASGVFSRDAVAVAVDAEGAAADAAEHLRRSTSGWWLHIDVDVLDPEEFPAQGLPDYPDEPGGLSRAELDDLVEALLREPGCVGASIAIYDPEQDQDAAGAAYLVRLAGAIAEAVRAASTPVRDRQRVAVADAPH